MKKQGDSEEPRHGLGTLSQSDCKDPLSPPKDLERCCAGKEGTFSGELKICVCA